MRFTLSWLKDYLDTDANLMEITDKLTSIGFEVEKIIDRSQDLSNFVTAEIIDTSSHPNAEKLKICKVDDGKNILQIVCGASNARAGIKTVLAPVGSVIPLNNLIIKKSKIRDIDSEGMLCSSEELMISDTISSGIIELNETIKNGTRITEALGYDDVIIEIAITPNRGDCLSVYGVARELAAAGIGNLKNIDFDILPFEQSPIGVVINTNLCDAYYGIYIDNIRNFTLPSKYLQRLNACGFKSHFGIVDLINYLTHSYNTPMHVYDANKIKGNINVRIANQDEKFTDLNGREYLLKGDLVIADSERILALAGIIGGKNSIYTKDTNNIFIEIALFDHSSITKTGRIYNILTDARYRFERKLDNLFIDRIENILVDQLKNYLNINSYKLIKIKNKDYQQNKIQFNIEKVQRITGCNIDKQIIIDILNRLGFIIDDKGKILNLIVPSWRNDISIEVDIVEEILRIYGYDKIELYKLKDESEISKPSISLVKSKIANVRRMLAANGFNEVISWSFMFSEKAELFADINEDLVLSNPISSELNYMRPTIIANLIEIYFKNSNRQCNDIAIFEIGNIYSSPSIQDQITSIAAIKAGNIADKNIYKDNRKYDLYDIKADCANVINQMGFDFSKLILDYTPVKYMHPHRSASLKIGKMKVGYFGQIHPKIINQYGLKNDIFAFEVYPDNIPIQSLKRTKYLVSDFQVVKRDFAFILPIAQESEKLLKLVQSVDRKLISKVELFDIYVGDNLDKNSKSLAFTVTIQPYDKTLCDKDIELISKNIINIVTEKLNGKLRNM